MTFDLTLSQATSRPVTVEYATDSNPDWRPTGEVGTAVPTNLGGSDYEATSGQVTFLPRETEQAVKVEVLPEPAMPGDLRFSLVLSNPTGATLADGVGTATIIDDPAAEGSTPVAGIGGLTIREPVHGSLSADLTVTLSTAETTAVKLRVQTADGTALAAGKHQTDASYRAVSAAVTIAAGKIQQNVTVPLLADPANAASLSFTADLSAEAVTVTTPTATVLVMGEDFAVTRSGRHPGPPRVALMGDSVTANYSDTEKAALEQLGYAVFPEGVPGSSIVDASQCQGQLADSVVSSIDPDVTVYENIGNYLWFAPCDPSITYGTPQFFAEWQATAQSDTNILTSHGGSVFWILGPQVNDPGQEAREAAIPQLNAIYQAVAASTPNTATIDAWDPFGGATPDCVDFRSPDCMHLNPAGEELMSQLVNAAILPL